VSEVERSQMCCRTFTVLHNINKQLMKSKFQLDPTQNSPESELPAHWKLTKIVLAVRNLLNVVSPSHFDNLDV